MKPRVTLITLGVDDLERAVRFYRDGLGLRTPGVVGAEFEHGKVAFFDLQPGLRLALWPRSSLAHDTGLSVGRRNATEFSLAHNVASREEVDEVMGQAAAAGASVTREAHDTFWGGYAGYFQDPDGHLWEVAWNPQMLPADPPATVTQLPLRTDRAATVQAVRPEREIMTRQRLPYFVGLSGETVGARGLSMHLIFIPPGARADPHLHVGYETGIYVLEGRVLTRWGHSLEHETISEAGEFLFVPPGVPHEAINLSDTLPARAVVARNDPAEQDRVEPYRPGGGAGG